MVNIKQFDNLLESFSNPDKLTTTLDSISERFDDQLNAINENTLEIKDNYDRINILDQKIDALAVKLETTYMMVSDLLKTRKKLENISLSDEEQKVFLGIYYETGKVSYAILSKKLGMRRSTVRLAVNSMKNKEIPILIKKEGTETFVIMDSKFRELQATQQLIKVDDKNKKNLFIRDLRYFF
ncbi:MAG: hypothetical protein ACOCUR_00525 [Nanoarchaeota archaeon]